MKPTVLLLTPRLPYPPDRGDRIRSWQVLRRLSQHARVLLASTVEEHISRETRAAIEMHAAETALASVAGRTKLRCAAGALARGVSLSERYFQHDVLHRAIEHWRATQRVAGVVAYCSSMFPYIASPAWQAVPRFVDLVDVDSRKWQDYAQSARSPLRMMYARESRRVRQLEERVCESAQVVAVTTPAEARELQVVVPASQPTVMSNGVEPADHAWISLPQTPQRVAFVGVLDYEPNISGIRWFVRHVWPVVRQQHPAATLTIVGKNPVAAVRRLAHTPGVSVHANTPDVKPYLAAAQAVIAPLAIARGVQNKVLEAFALRRAVIASPAVAAGLAAESERHFLTAASASEWQGAIGRLFTDDAERERLAAAGQAFASEHHDWARTLQPLEDWIARLQQSRSTIDSKQRHVGELQPA